MVTSYHTGSSALLAYGYESAFGGGATLSRLFGKEQKCNSLEFMPNLQPLGQVYTPEIQDFLFKRNEGSCSMEYILSNPWVFGFILNDANYSAGAPDTHTWHSDPDAAAHDTSMRDILSGHLEIFQAGKDANVDRNCKGVISPSLNIKTAINQPVQCSQKLIWGKEDTVDTTMNATPPISETFTPYSFVHGSVKLPVAGGTLRAVQDLDITFDTGAELVWEIDESTGGANAIGAFRKIINMTGKITIALADKTFIDAVQARTALADMELKFTNGLSGDNEKSITMTFTGVGLSRHNSQGIAPGEFLTESFDFQCKSVIVVAKNDQTDQFA